MEKITETNGDNGDQKDRDRHRKTDRQAQKDRQRQAQKDRQTGTERCLSLTKLLTPTSSFMTCILSHFKLLRMKR